jgi:hypothetical protein
VNQHGRQKPKRLESASRRTRTRTGGDLAWRHELLLEASASVEWDWEVESGRVALEGDVAGLLGAGTPVVTIQDVLELIHPEDRRMHQASLEHALVKGRGPYTSAFRIVRPDDGRIVFIEDRGWVSWEDDFATLRVTGFLFRLSA